MSIMATSMTKLIDNPYVTEIKKRRENPQDEYFGGFTVCALSDARNVTSKRSLLVGPFLMLSSCRERHYDRLGR